jgi:hypothetical protein
MHERMAEIANGPFSGRPPVTGVRDGAEDEAGNDGGSERDEAHAECAEAEKKHQKTAEREHDPDRVPFLARGNDRWLKTSDALRLRSLAEESCSHSVLIGPVCGQP